MNVEVIAGRVVLRNDTDGRPHEVTYVCRNCEKKWMRFTKERILLPETCPYCGGEPRLTSDTRDNDGDQQRT